MPLQAKAAATQSSESCLAHGLIHRDIASSILDPSKPIFAESGQLKALTGEVAPPVMEVVVDTETASRWNLILSEEFEDGLRLNGMRLRKFRSIYEERYHDAVEPDDEKLIAMLKQVGEFRDERI